jgi:uncharacterized membrane protein YcjF (UPF0283 family)
MSIKEDYQKAKVLAIRKEYAEARKLLLPYNHAKTNALLAYITKAESQLTTKQSNFKFIGGIVGVIVSSIITGWLFSIVYNAFDGKFTNVWIIYTFFAIVWMLIFAVIFGIIQRFR